MGLFMPQMFGQPLIVRTDKVPVHQAVQQAGFPASRGHRQTVRGNCASLITIPPAEALLQQCLDRPGKLGGCRGGHLDPLTATTDRVLQAALMKRLRKPVETSRPVVHQKTGAVLSRNRRRLGIPTMRFNHVDRDLLAQQNPADSAGGLPLSNLCHPAIRPLFREFLGVLLSQNGHPGRSIDIGNHPVHAHVHLVQALLAASAPRPPM